MGLCTRFPTEIVLRHNTESERVTASIQPHSSRDDQSQEPLKKYRRELPNMTQLPEVIEEVSSLMQIRGHNSAVESNAFSSDVLRIEVEGPGMLQLTIVDLPGLITNPSDEQKDGDVDMVWDMVEGYLCSTRTIILTVLQAPNDVANQPILKLARTHDSDGGRTVGIITKADLINEGTEPKIANLAKNEDSTKLKLGFFLLEKASLLGIIWITQLSWYLNGVNQAIAASISEEQSRREISLMCRNSLDEANQLARRELAMLLEDERRQPITYNHYYTDNIQNARHQSQKSWLKTAVESTMLSDWSGKTKLHTLSNTPETAERLVSTLSQRIVVDMDEQACDEALAGLNAYYKVAIKTFVDNVCRQVIERHVLAALPDIFCPRKVSQLDDQELQRIGSESEKQRNKRRELSEAVRVLQTSLKELSNPFINA